MAHDTKKGQAVIRHALKEGGTGLKTRSRTEGTKKKSTESELKRRNRLEGNGTKTTNHVASRTTGGVRGRSRTEGGTPSTLKRRKRT